MEQNYRLTIAYDGSRFFGWERQPDKDTIQGKLEAVLGTLQGHPVNVIGAGRTDAGVHARAMTANVVLDALAQRQEGQSVKETILALRRFEGLQHPVVFDEFGEARRDSLIMVVRDGQFVVVQ